MATPIVMPRLGDFMTEGTVVKLARSQGDQVGQGEVIAEIETEKLNYDLQSVAGGIFHPVVAEGATVEVDGLIAYVLEAGEEAPEAETSQAQASPSTARQAPASRPAAASGSGRTFRSTPGARKVASSLGVDLAQVPPTGPGGRIVEADVRAFAERQTVRSCRGTVNARSAPTGATAWRRSVGDYTYGTRGTNCRGRRSRFRRSTEARPAARPARSVSQ